MRAAFAKRIAELQTKQDRGRVAFVNGALITYLAYDADPGDPEDRACDKCHTIVPLAEQADGVDNFFTFAQEFHGARPGVPNLILAGGFCRACAEAEGLMNDETHGGVE
jgi:hypothetical protein